MKLKRLATVLLAGILSVGSVTQAFARTPVYSSWDGVRSAYGQEHEIGHSVEPRYQFWGPGKTGPATPQYDVTFGAHSLEVCKRDSDYKFIIRGNGYYLNAYYRYGDQYKAVCTYNSGTEDMHTDYTYYIPCSTHKYYVDPSRSGDFFATNINGTRYNYKKDGPVQIGDGSYIDYTDSNHNGSDIYKWGTITFRLAHSSNGSWSSNDNGHWNTCTGCGGTVNYANHTWSSWINANNNQHYRKCTVCGKQQWANHYDAGGGKCVCGKVMHVHNYTQFVKYDKEPTCTQGGTATYKCPTNGATKSGVSVPATGHTYGAPYIHQKRDCTHDEIWYKDCKSKDSTIEETSKRVTAPGHNWEWKWYPNNGVENAYMLETCTRTWDGVPCGATRGEMNWTKHTTTYLSVDQDNGIELGRQTKTLNRGTIVHGNDIGEEDIVYDGIQYHYVGCEEAKVDGDTTVKRFYRKTQYVITYDANGGTGSMGTQTIKYDEETTLLPNQFTRVGYTWKGWSKEKTGDPAYTDQQKVTNIIQRTDAGNTVTLYSIWEANKYTVHFTNTKGITVADKVVTYDSPYGELPDLKTTTERLRSWCRVIPRGDTTGLLDIDSTTIVRVDGDHELQADWEDLAWNVTFVTPHKTQIIKTANGQKTVAPFEPNETGMEFLRWSLTPNGEDAYDFNQPVTEDMTIYGVFKAGEYTITLPGAGTVKRTYPDKIGNLPNGVQTGQKFEGWYYDPDLTQKVNPTDTIQPNDMTLYPKFTTGEYKLTLEGRNEQWTMHYGDAIPELPTPEVIGKTFKGWTYQSKVYSTGDTYEWDGDIMLSPWYQTVQVTIIYPDGSAKMKDAGQTVGELPPAPEKQGQEFLGYVDDKGNWVTEATKADRDMTISYKYSASTIKLTLVDGDWTTVYQVEAGVTLTGLPTRTKNGFTFRGWSTYANGPVTRGPLYHDTTLYSSWETGQQDIVLVDLGQTIKRKTGDPLGTLPEARKDGYRFKGWMNGTDLVSSTTTVPAGGMTLTAWFEQIDTSHTDKVIIRYWSDGVRINTEDLTKGETLWDPGAPAVSSVDTRHFVYWSATPDGDPYSFGHAVNTDVNLYAVWK